MKMENKGGTENMVLTGEVEERKAIEIKRSSVEFQVEEVLRKSLGRWNLTV